MNNSMLPTPFKNGLNNFLTDFFETPTAVLVPPLDVLEDHEGYTLTLEVPGLSAKDVSVECENGEMIIRGEKSEERPKEAEVLRRERAFGSFERRITLSDLADDSKITAAMKDGVLSIHVPKKPEAKPRKVKIDVK